MDKAFTIHPTARKEDADYVFFKRTEIWRTLRKVKNHLLQQEKEVIVQDEAGGDYVKQRKHRQATTRLRHELPDLSKALHEYRNNLTQIIDAVERNNATIVMPTQPSLWRTDLPEELGEFRWFGGVGEFQEGRNREYYSVDALARVMDLFNSALLSVCEARQIDCFDLAAAVPKDTSIFYDDVHFNESGARAGADFVANELEAHGLFNALSTGSSSAL